MALRLTAETLWIERGGRAIIQGLSFEADAGSALLVTGPNGAGKTTLIRAVAGFLPLASGRLRLEGGTADTPLFEQCHWLGHANAVKGALTVRENLEFWCRYLRGEAARIAPAIERFSLQALADVPAAYLSAGQQRRVGLARVLVAPRPVWLLDEPSVSLDAASTAVLGGVINEHTAAGGLAVVATHLPLGLARVRELVLVPAAPAADEAAA